MYTIYAKFNTPSSGPYQNLFRRLGTYNKAVGPEALAEETLQKQPDPEAVAQILIVNEPGCYAQLFDVVTRSTFGVVPV